MYFYLKVYLYSCICDFVYIGVSELLSFWYKTRLPSLGPSLFASVSIVQYFFVFTYLTLCICVCIFVFVPLCWYISLHYHFDLKSVSPYYSSSSGICVNGPTYFVCICICDYVFVSVSACFCICVCTFVFVYLCFISISI